MEKFKQSYYPQIRHDIQILRSDHIRRFGSQHSFVALTVL